MTATNKTPVAQWADRAAKIAAKRNVAPIVACNAWGIAKRVEAAVDRLLLIFLRRYIRRGSFKVTMAGGTTYALGDGSGPPIAVRFTTAAAQRAVLLDPELKLGETYMDGSLIVEQGSIADVIPILLGQERIESPAWALPF